MSQGKSGKRGGPVKRVRIGDIVTRKSYGGDIFFRVEAVLQQEESAHALLRGLFVRLYADAPVDDLERKDVAEINTYRREFAKKHTEYLRQVRACQYRTRQIALVGAGRKEDELDFFELPGRVLHLNGDHEYQEICLNTYLQLGVPSHVLCVPEKEQPAFVCRCLRKERPDILVLTGHDGLLKGTRDFRCLDNYRHSRYFLEAVRYAREYEFGRDDLVIIAGGCQSYYEALIEAGANFASAPERIMIHVLDPVFIAEKISYTSIYEKISLPEVLDQAVTGAKGIGGIQTRGKFRLGLPRSRY